MSEDFPSYVAKFKIVPDIDDAKPSALAARMLSEGAGRIFGDYRICKGLYSKYPLAHQRDRKKFGSLFVSMHKERVVAFSYPNLTWVAPEHRGHGLAPEMIADMIETYGGPDRFYAINPVKQRTAGGAKMTIATRKILVARGIVK